MPAVGAAERPRGARRTATGAPHPSAARWARGSSNSRSRANSAGQGGQPSALHRHVVVDERHGRPSARLGCRRCAPWKARRAPESSTRRTHAGQPRDQVGAQLGIAIDHDEHSSGLRSPATIRIDAVEQQAGPRPGSGATTTAADTSLTAPTTPVSRRRDRRAARKARCSKAARGSTRAPPPRRREHRRERALDVPGCTVHLRDRVTDFVPVRWTDSAFFTAAADR
jgi:hypothetical protein